MKTTQTHSNLTGQFETHAYTRNQLDKSAKIKQSGSRRIKNKFLFLDTIQIEINENSG